MENEQTPLDLDLTVWGMYLHADIVVKTVMIGLIIVSIITWAIFFAKGIQLLIHKNRLKKEHVLLSAARSLQDASNIAAEFSSSSLSSILIQTAVQEHMLSQACQDQEGIKERTGFQLERLVAQMARYLGYGNGYLATVGAIAPFIGLFGTVWGIMHSFIGIARSQTTNLAVVAPGIAEALLATAIGLVAAIPAVVIYNLFARVIGGYKAVSGDVAAQVLLLQSRDFDLMAGNRSASTQK